ncbi:MAG: class I SAM-dependent methyltransferase [Nitrososphaerota archaeon]|jgi:SAM-dependent methyltransferase|nr:class I SAM-dependent methyltransferase [Nitrososphaerota archaeon]
MTENVSFMERAAKTCMGKYLSEIEMSFIAKTVDFSKFSLVLDVGSESGRLSFLAVNNNVTNVVNIDIDRGSLVRFRQRMANACVILADARYLPFKSGIFDAVFMLEVLDYFSEIDVALNEGSRILKSGSDCVLTFGNKSSLKGKIKSLGGGRGHSYFHSYGEVMQVLLKTDFCIHAHLGFNWLPFGRTSQNSLVPFFVWLERVFRLRKLCKYSPWVICHVIKQLNDT